MMNLNQLMMMRKNEKALFLKEDFVSNHGTVCQTIIIIQKIQSHHLKLFFFHKDVRSKANNSWQKYINDIILQ